MEYLDLIARINNNFIRKNYSLALKFCKKAESIAPREPSTWEYTALVEFYHELKVEKTKNPKEILKACRINFDLCEANMVEQEKIKEIKGEIANELFIKAKTDIGQYYSRSKKNKGYWGKIGRKGTINCLKIFEDCYRLTSDSLYLKSYVDELSKPYKWIVKNLEGELINLPACGKKFDAVHQIERNISKIKKIEPLYEPTEVLTERFKISVEAPSEKEDNNDAGIYSISFE